MERLYENITKQKQGNFGGKLKKKKLLQEVRVTTLTLRNTKHKVHATSTTIFHI